MRKLSSAERPAEARSADAVGPVGPLGVEEAEPEEEVMLLEVLLPRTPAAAYIARTWPGCNLDRLPLALGSTFGRHAIQSLIGRGGMGEVYRAIDTRLHRLVALKVLRTDGDRRGRRGYRSAPSRGTRGLLEHGEEH